MNQQAIIAQVKDLELEDRILKIVETEEEQPEESHKITVDEIYFTDDLHFYRPFGKYPGHNDTSQPYTISAKNKSLKQLLDDAFESTSTIIHKTLPEFNFSIGQYQAHAEVGCTYTIPNATLSVVSVGTFEYGTTASRDSKNNSGIVINANDATITTTGGNSTSNTQLLKQNSSFTHICDTHAIYTESPAEYVYTVTVNYQQSAIPYNAAGEQDSSNIINAGTYTESKTITFTGQRYKFWGYRTRQDGILDVNSLTSENIRNSIHTQSGTEFPTTITFPIGTKQIILAAPHNSLTKKIVLTHQQAGKLDFNNNNERVQNKLNVEGYDGYTATPYDFWYVNIDAAIIVQTTYSVSWE